MHKEGVVKVRLYLLLCLIFLSINLLFVNFKPYIDGFSRSIFAFTGELSPRQSPDDKPAPGKPAAAKPAPQAKNTPAQPKEAQKPKEEPKAKPPPPPPPPPPDLNNPVVRDLPKTKPPVIAFTASVPDFNDPKIPTFPELRNFTGDRWGQENTDIRMATTGPLLYVHITCFDKNPYGLITKNAKAKPSEAWKDDCIQIFLMKDADADHYCQYVASAAGIHFIFYMKADPENPLKGTSAKLPEGFVDAKSVIKVTYNAFTVDMIIDISNNLGLEAAPGKTVLMQIVRGYRGNQASLQLFPNHIYCDSRNKMNNHDRRAFIPVEIRDLSAPAPEPQTGKADDTGADPKDKKTVPYHDPLAPKPQAQKKQGDDPGILDLPPLD